VRLTALPPSCAVVMKSGNVNFQEPFGPLRDRYGTDLPFTHGHLHTVTYTRGRIDTIDSPDDEHLVSRNMYRIGINRYKVKNCG